MSAAKENETMEELVARLRNDMPYEILENKSVQY